MSAAAIRLCFGQLDGLARVAAGSSPSPSRLTNSGISRDCFDLMNASSRNTIVILKLQPHSPRAKAGGLLRICASGYGETINRAEQELNSAIEASETGQRDLVPLHRLRATRAYSKATSLRPIETTLALIHSKLGKEMNLPMRGFFDVPLEEAIQAVEDGLAEHKKKLVATKKRKATAKKVRNKLNAQKRALEPIVEDVVRHSQPHPEELRDALDGLDGKRIQTWAEKRLAQLQKSKESAAQKITESRRLRELTVKHAKDVELDIVTLREIQREIERLTDERVALTLTEEDYLYELEQDAESYYAVVDHWSYGLPENLQDFADEVTSAVRDWCPLAGSFEDLVKEILIDDWDEDDD